MKKLVIAPLLILAGNLLGQVPASNLYEVPKATKKMYADKRENYIIAFDMGQHLDKAGIGYAIRETDTLFLQPDNSFKGKLYKIYVSDEQMYISRFANKKRSTGYKLEKVTNTPKAFYNLNNAYFLDSYFSMSRKLNKKFELNHHSFRTGFFLWKTLANKEIDHAAFRSFTDRFIQQNEDSISARQEYLTTLTHYLINNVDQLSYPAFRDSIIKIPAEFAYQSSYYRTVVSGIAQRKPEYVISLYNEFPQNRTLISFAVETDKFLSQKLKELQKAIIQPAKKK